MEVVSLTTLNDEAIAPPLEVDQTRRKTKSRRISRKVVGLQAPQVQCSLAFQNVKFSVGKKTLIQKATGIVLPGELLTIMGPSGCGKTTLLSILAKRTSQYGRRTKVDGEVLFNGKRAGVRDRADLLSMVPQDAALIGDFTVQEIMWIQARLYFGWRGFSRSELEKKVTAILTALGINDCRDVKVGSIFAKGLSGGQKRRLSISVELVSSPSIILLDEPTTGLDSATSLGIFKLLLRLASFGHTVICTIHQPSSQMWGDMSKIMFMSQGYVTYYGEASNCVLFFETLGLFCPRRFNPSEYFIGIVTNDFDLPAFGKKIPVPEIAETFETTPMFTTDILGKIEEAIAKASFESSAIQFGGSKQVSFFSQFVTLTMRNFLNYRRNVGIFMLRLFLFTFLALVFGLVFLNTGDLEGDIGVSTSIGAAAVSLAYFIVLSLTAIPFIMEDRAVFQREVRNGAYRRSALVLSLIFISVLSTGVIAVCAALPVIYMSKVTTPLINNIAFVWVGVLYAEFVVFTLGAVSPHYIVGIAVAVTWYGFGLITSGYFVKFTDMSWVIRWIGLVNPHHYLYIAQVISEYPLSRNITNGVLFPDSQAVLTFFDVGNQSLDTAWGNWGIAFGLMVGWGGLFFLVVELFW